MKKENKTGKIKGTEKNLKSIYIEHRKKEKMWGMNSDEMLIPHLKVTFCPHPPTLCRRLQLKHTSFILKSSKVQKPKFTASKKKNIHKVIRRCEFPHSKNLQTFSWYFETFWWFTKFSFQQKWNDARLLLMNMVYTSFLTSCRMT